jgi:hypothetical protein
VVLDGPRLLFYEDEKRKNQGKVIEMTKVNYVSFHYDENAPIKSKRLSNKEKDESRFDIYTSERVFMMHSDGNSVFESNAWVEILEKAAKKYS